MPLYNVELTINCTMVVQAEDAGDAHDIAYDNWKDGLSDADPSPQLQVTGEVTHEKHLRDGWDGMCLPYGGDGKTRISSLLADS